MVKPRKLGVHDVAIAQELFALMAAVFEEAGEERAAGARLTADDVRAMLERESFWAVAALEGDDVVGGITAHALPMTRSRSTELFIYDLAVRADRQRRGIGRALVTELLTLARAAGIETTFVPADNEDSHALAFYRAIGGEPSPVTFFTFSA
jgi:aminoglycoside 3-N-acetyltransferase I